MGFVTSTWPGAPAPGFTVRTVVAYNAPRGSRSSRAISGESHGGSRCWRYMARSLLFMTLGAVLIGCAGSHAAEPKQTLAPSGALRVGLYRGGPTSVIPGATPEETKGVGHDLGKELARRLGARFEPAVYASPGALIAAGKSGEWDVAFLAVDAEREKILSFTAPFLFVEHGYLVPAGSSITKMEEIDRPGTRVGAPQGGSINAVLKRVLRSATVMNSAGLAGGVEMMKAGQVDAFAANKANLYQMSDKLPGSRVLPGHLDLDRIAIAIPKGREAGLDYLTEFIRSAKAEGRVQAAMTRAGLRGARE